MWNFLDFECFAEFSHYLEKYVYIYQLIKSVALTLVNIDKIKQSKLVVNDDAYNY